MINYSSMQLINNNLWFHHSIDKAPFEYSTHLHDGYEIYFLISGGATSYIEGTCYSLVKNDILIINTKELHRLFINSDTVYERKVLHFKPEILSIFDFTKYNLLSCFENRKLGHNNLLKGNDKTLKEIDYILTKVEECTKVNTTENQLLVKTYIIQLLIVLNKLYSEQEISPNFILDDGLTSNILNYINKNLSSKITLDLLQEKFYLNKYYLSHYFKENTGFTLIEYLTYKRIMKAKELILKDIPINQLSMTVGFRDYSNFYKAFKKITGLSPSQYKKKIGYGS
ncbi:AraC family transcriptional regulator [Clostridium sediminicola]|uniref:AraC family transcriptional regulator n=1 Tax=Clostridium sediminicola TaxID=3114879 RepID=UPI0031F1EBBA